MLVRYQPVALSGYSQMDKAVEYESTIGGSNPPISIIYECNCIFIVIGVDIKYVNYKEDIMGDIVKFSQRKDSAVEESSVSPLVEGFFATEGSYTNIELKPAYVIYFEDVDGWDGKINKIEELSKDESYISMLGSGTCGLYSTDTVNDEILNYRIAELDSDIEKADGGYKMILVFSDELESWVFEALKDNKLFLSVC